MRKGAYQGIAQDHFVEFELGAAIGPTSKAALTLVASGWIYPTDSSINVAIGQGGHVTPSGLALEAQVRDGRWVVVNPDLGFPAGKNKTILVDLSRVPADATRLRLRTNLEIYWDQLAVSDRSQAQVRTTRLPADERGAARSGAIRRRPRRAAMRRRRRSTSESPIRRSAGATWSATTRASVM